MIATWPATPRDLLHLHPAIHSQQSPDEGSRHVAVRCVTRAKAPPGLPGRSQIDEVPFPSLLTKNYTVQCNVQAGYLRTNSLAPGSADSSVALAGVGSFSRTPRDFHVPTTHADRVLCNVKSPGSFRPPRPACHATHLALRRRTSAGNSAAGRQPQEHPPTSLPQR